jgi:hypothetical protein
MIFERRAYTFRPGKIETFWKAQEEWNTPAVYSCVLDHNLSYFSTVSGPTDTVIQLYRFKSMDHWKVCYDQYYGTQKLDYFQLVRPCMVRQENGFFAAPPVAELSPHLSGPKPQLPPPIAKLAKAAPGQLRVVETVIDFFPGGLPIFWEACRMHRAAEHPIDAPARIGVLVSVIGRIHRVVLYHGFAASAEAEAHKVALTADPAWQAFEADFQHVVADRMTSYLKLAPIPRMRTLFER